MKNNVTIMHFRVGFLYNGYIYLYMCCYEERQKTFHSRNGHNSDVKLLHNPPQNKPVLSDQIVENHREWGRLMQSMTVDLIFIV